MNPNEVLIKELTDLAHCESDCSVCSVARQDEGDEKPWCGYLGVLNSAIGYIQHLDDLENEHSPKPSWWVK